MTMLIRLFGVLLLAGLLIAVFKLALLLIIITGLIFRTKETVGLLAIGGIMNLFILHPVAGVVGTAVLLSIGAYFKRKEKQKQMEDPNSVAALPAPDDP